MGYQAKVITGGKIVIPADVRRELGIADGDHLNIEVADGKVTLSTRKRAIEEIQARFAHLKIEGVSLVDELIADRRAENERDEAESRSGKRFNGRI